MALVALGGETWLARLETPSRRLSRWDARRRDGPRRVRAHELGRSSTDHTEPASRRSTRSRRAHSSRSTPPRGGGSPIEPCSSRRPMARRPRPVSPSAIAHSPSCSSLPTSRRTSRSTTGPALLGSARRADHDGVRVYSPIGNPGCPPRTSSSADREDRHRVSRACADTGGEAAVL